MPKLPLHEYEALKTSVATEGQHYPIIANQEGTILDGHHRFKVCRELSIEPRFEVKQFASKVLERKFVIEANLRRRHLSDFQRAELAYPLLEIEQELAKQRQAELGKTHGEDPFRSFELKGQARDIVAKQAGLSPATFQRAVYILEKAPDTLKEKSRKGEVSIQLSAPEKGKREE